MAESPPPPREILSDILRVLERIEVQLETHDSRVKSLEDLVKSNDHSSVQSPWSDVVDSNFDQTTSRSIDQLPRAVTKRERLTASDTTGRHNDEQAGLEDGIHEDDHSTKVEYSFWKSDNDDTFYDTNEILDQDRSAVLAKYLGESYLIPDDFRLSLQLGWRDRSLHKELLTTSASAKIRRLQALQDFDNDLRAQSGNDFLVVDFDSSNNSRLYRIGETAIGNKIMVSPENSKIAPWSRLM